jgi:hypothetical protein
MNARLWMSALLLIGARVVTAQSASTLRFFSSEQEFRAAVGNASADAYTDYAVETNVRKPLDRVAGLYRYRLSGRPFGLFISGSESEPWISVMDPPQSTLFIDGFRPSVRAVGAYVFGTFQTHQKSKVSIKVTIVTAAGRKSTTLHDTNAQTFFGVVSSRLPILSLRVEAVQDFPFELYPSVRAVVLGSAVVASDPKSPD